MYSWTEAALHRNPWTQDVKRMQAANWIMLFTEQDSACGSKSLYGHHHQSRSTAWAPTPDSLSRTVTPVLRHRRTEVGTLNSHQSTLSQSVFVLVSSLVAATWMACQCKRYPDEKWLSLSLCLKNSRRCSPGGWPHVVSACIENDTYVDTRGQHAFSFRLDSRHNHELYTWAPFLTRTCRACL